MRISLKTLLIFMGLVFPLIVIIIIRLFTEQRSRAQLTRCKSNLMQMSRAMFLYIDSKGRNVFYPNANGSLFLVRLYTTNILEEPHVFLCPATRDTNDDGRLLLTLKPGDAENACSYAGRKNANQQIYPGFYHTKFCGLTSMGGDDIDPFRGENHALDTVILFQDGHAETSYSLDGPESRTIFWRDPLTN